MRFRDLKIVEEATRKKQKDGDYARHGEKTPAAEPGRSEHPLKGRLVGSVERSARPINEGARIQHAEDIIFWEGSKGAVRAIESLKSLEQGKHTDVTIKWDGSPAIIFGRDDDGSFVLTDKSGFTAKGYDGKAKSAEDLNAMLMNRPGASNPDPKKAASYKQFASNMAKIYSEYEKAVPQDYRGFFKGDLLYFNTPQVVQGHYVFKPNIVQYKVKANSDIGKRIGQSSTGIVIHREVDASGNEGPLKSSNIFQGSDVLVLPPVTAQNAPQVNDDHIKELQAMVSRDGAAIDAMLNEQTLIQLKLKAFPDLLYNYLNSKVDTGLSNLGQDFLQWLSTKNSVSDAGKKKVADYVRQHEQGFNALWNIVTGIMKVKDDIINQLEQQETDITASINGQEGGEGYVLAHPEGDIKLVPREFFTRANRAVQR